MDTRVADKNNLISSEQWEFSGDSPIQINSDAYHAWKSESRNVLDGLREVLDRSSIVSNYGLVSLRTAGIIWKRICNEIEILNIDLSAKKWGEKSARRKVLLKYRLSDHRFDTRYEEKETLLFFLESHKMELEKYIREIANEFKIEIPLKRQKDFLDQFS